MSLSSTEGHLDEFNRQASACDVRIVKVPLVIAGSILKKVRRVSNENGERTSRLRFSDVNEYNSIDGDQCLSKRVKVRPIYSEPAFSSDD